ncbi:MAG: hypothetical protein ACR2MN_14930 [Acidimicrobiales bacterium]
MTRIDATSEFHGHVLEYVSDIDRAYFNHHPEVSSYQRPAEEHEFCDPRSYPQCSLLFPTPPRLEGATLQLMVTVTELKPGVRGRSPWWTVTS